MAAGGGGRSPTRMAGRCGSRVPVLVLTLAVAALGHLPSGRAATAEVYLRSMTIHQTHERGWNGKRPEVYVRCDDDGRGDVDLHRVKHKEEPYLWDPLAVAITFLPEGGSRRCRLRERDKLDPDDTFGEFELRWDDFKAPEGMNEVAVAGEFDAKFQCQGCVPPPASPSVNLTLAAGDGNPTGDSHRAIDAQASSNSSTGPSFSSASAPGISLRASASSTPAGDAGASHTGHHHGATAGSAIAAGMLCLMVGVVGGIVAYRLHHAVKQRREEERMRELDAILGDPDVDFEQMAAQDGKALGWSFSRLWNGGRRMWMRVPETGEKPL